MADYNGMEALLASTENLTQLLNNVGHDDDTLTFNGVDWFKFNGTVAQNIYVSGNSWFGFGTSAEQLQVCRRDAKLWNFWREEGTLYNYYKFLRLKWDGYSQYNSTSDSVHLTYEVYLFSTGDIFLNVLRMPADSSYLGTNQLICTGGTKAFTVTAGQTLQETFTHANDSGTDFTAAAGLINIQAPYDRKSLITDKGGKIYSVVTTEGVLSLSEIENPGEISKALFETHGVDDMPPGSLLLTLINPALLFWQDSQDSLPVLEADVTAVPFPQAVLTENVDMTDSTIIGIEKVTADADDATLFAVSFDGGTTWWNYVNNAWAVLSDEQSGMTKAALADIGTDAWALKATTGHYRFRFVLFEESYVNSIVVDYLN